MGTKRIFLFTLGFALAAIPASATITYTSCTAVGAGNACTETTGSYAALPTETGASGLTFSSLVTFSSTYVSSGIYTDLTTGVVFTNYIGSGVDTGAIVNSGGYLEQGTDGTNTGFQITLPANTYAIGLVVGACSSFFSCGTLAFNSATMGVGTQSTHGTNYAMTLTNSGTQFFAIVSDAPIASLFFASGSNNTWLGLKNFEIGTEAPGGATPELATSALIGGGLVGLYFVGRRRDAATNSRR